MIREKNLINLTNKKINNSHTFRKAKMTDYTGATIKLPQEVARSLDQQLTSYTTKD